MKIKFTKKVRTKLQQMGFMTLLSGRKYVHPEVRFEMPCSLLEVEFADVPIEIGAFSYVGRGFRYYSPLKIGRFCSIAEDVKIGLHSHPTDRVSTSPYFYAKKWNWNGKNRPWNQAFEEMGMLEEYNEAAQPVEIGHDVWIGANACIKGGIKIGDGAIVACGAVVTKDVAPFSIVGGVPAHLIKMRQIESKPSYFGPAYVRDICGTLTQRDFAQFLPLKKRIRNFFKNENS